jgi:hypothetical protein
MTVSGPFYNKKRMKKLTPVEQAKVIGRYPEIYNNLKYRGIYGMKQTLRPF